MHKTSPEGTVGAKCPGLRNPRRCRGSGAQRWRVRAGGRGRARADCPHRWARPRIARANPHPGRAGEKPGPVGAVMGGRGRHGLQHGAGRGCSVNGGSVATGRTEQLKFFGASGERSEVLFHDCLYRLRARPVLSLGNKASGAARGRCITNWQGRVSRSCRSTIKLLAPA